jgi:asparagine synthase (glutamine-hydrolysing)
MCGIAGFINFQGHNRSEAQVRLKRMTDIIAHRGPDAEGFYVDSHAALGHRRLSIIDIASGQQPMGIADGRYQIVFNGEIYNFLEIRTELEKKGHRFRTNSDTEVILYAYAEWGETCVERMNGMFAFVIWDCTERKAFCARDRVGKKPLYYLTKESGIAFASELKALLAGGFSPGEIDPESLDCYFTFGYVPSPRSIFKNIKKLRAAHTITFNSSGQFEKRYWDLRYDGSRVKSMDEAIEEFEALLDDAVRIRLMSEVPLGAFLSGGIDSPLVVSSMAKALQRPVLTNSIGFEENGYNELPLARLVAKHLKTDHREFVVRPNILDVMEQIAWHFDEPFADSSAVPTWYVCKMARENVTVALSGDGGDEGYGGYTFRYVPHILESKIRNIIPGFVKQHFIGPIGNLYPNYSKLPKILRLKTIIKNLSVSDEEAFYNDLSRIPSGSRERLYSKEFQSILKGFSPFEMVRSIYKGNNAPDPLGRSQYSDINLFMTEDVLVKVDRLSMAHGLEIRSPFLDHRLIKFGLNLPASYKINGLVGKILLRSVAVKRLPLKIANQRKIGFSPPLAGWIRKDAKAFVEDTLKSSNICSQYFNNKEIDRIYNIHNKGYKDYSSIIWSAVMINMWANALFKGDIKCAQ